MPKYNFSSPSSATPILLLKTKSSPADSYDEFFSANNYSPVFIPVLEHHFHTQNLNSIRQLLESGALNPGPDRKYGGLIFTSQRAVEGFAGLVGELDDTITHPASTSLPLYTVGPATARSLTTLRDAHLPHATIHGAETGNGENLAHYILSHYNGLHSEKGTPNLPLLFMVGEQRRDVIPRTLMGDTLPVERRIGVDEVVVYETGVMEGFEGDFGEAVRAGEEFLVGGDGDGGEERVVWVVVFSPTGCEAMLRVLGEGGKRRERMFVATIGPTTRDHLVREFGVQPEVCAEKPSQEGVARGIERFMEGWMEGRK